MTVSPDHESHAQAKDSYVSAQETYYALLGVNPASSVQEIRQAYRELSKLYHPDTTQLKLVEAKQKFQRLNEAYATLSNPEKRLQYDLKAGFSRFSVVQPPTGLQTTKAASRQSTYSSSAYLDPNDRPLSPGEIFALVILGITFLLCLILAVVLSFAHSEAKFELLRGVNNSTGDAIVADVKSTPPSVHLELFTAPVIFKGRSESLTDTPTPESQDTEPTPEATVEPSPPQSKIPWLPSFASPSPEPEAQQATDTQTVVSDAPIEIRDQPDRSGLTSEIQ